MKNVNLAKTIYEEKNIFEVEHCSSYGITEEIRDIQSIIIEASKVLLSKGYLEALVCFGEKVRNDGIVELHSKVYACKDDSLSSHLHSRYHADFSKRNGFDKARCFVLNEKVLNRFN